MIPLPPAAYRALAALAVVIALLSLVLYGLRAVYAAGERSGRAEVRTEYNAHLAKDASTRAAAGLAARARELALQADHNALMENHRHALAHLDRQHRADLERLRRRAAGRAGADTGGVPATTGAGVGCTGEGLARPDAEFLVGYAADAGRLAAAFHTCDTAYRALRQPPAAGVDSTTSE